MFGLFGKRQHRHSGEEPNVLDAFLKPMALAVAVAEAIGEYFEEAQNGNVEARAYKRQEASVVEIWRDSRLEVLHKLWAYEGSNAMLLADYQRQKEILECLLDQKPHLEFPHLPRGEEVPDTIQALFQVYVLMHEIGSHVACKETDRLNLKAQKKSIFDDFLSRAVTLRNEWISFEEKLKEPSSNDGEEFSIPKTVFEILYDDVTAKTKSIALTARFGPNYRLGMQYLNTVVRKEMEKQGASEKEIQEAIEKIGITSERILASTDPDHLI